MRIVVAGAGLAGRRLIAGLTANRHDVSAIDLNRDICELVSSKLGVVALCGNATEFERKGTDWLCQPAQSGSSRRINSCFAVP